MKHILNVKTKNLVEVEETSEELAKIDLETVEWNAKKTERETARQAKETNQASGNQKLLDLGLTQAEATALTGYTPPTEESE